jgi:Cdc6-like AAA superfamily ATPase
VLFLPGSSLLSKHPQFVEMPLSKYFLNSRDTVDSESSTGQRNRHIISDHPTVVPRFYGRAKELDMMRSLIHQQPRQRCKSLILWGFSGTGKTRLVLRYMNEHRQSFSSIIWINGNNNETAMQLSEEISQMILQSNKGKTFQLRSQIEKFHLLAMLTNGWKTKKIKTGSSLLTVSPNLNHSKLESSSPTVPMERLSLRRPLMRLFSH